MNSKDLLKNYQLTWSDEFEGKMLDKTKWSHRLLGPRGDAVLVKGCAQLDGKGSLRLTTRRNKGQIETGMVGIEGIFETKFGYFEAKMKFQTELGHWSAFWLQSPNMAKVGAPEKNGVEIDIIEFFSTDRESMFMNVHWDGYGDHHKKTGYQYKDATLKHGWHVVGLEWTPDEYVFFLDGKEVWRTDEAISQTEQYIILSLEVRDWAGDISKSDLPDSVFVDYVRVYKSK